MLWGLVVDGTVLRESESQEGCLYGVGGEKIRGGNEGK